MIGNGRVEVAIVYKRAGSVEVCFLGGMIRYELPTFLPFLWASWLVLGVSMHAVIAFFVIQLHTEEFTNVGTSKFAGNAMG